MFSTLLSKFVRFPLIRSLLRRQAPAVFREAEPSVITHEFGLALQELRVFMQVIPDLYIESVCGLEKGLVHKRFAHTTDKPCMFQTLHEGICGAQQIRDNLVSYVEPENLLFIFRQCFRQELDTEFAFTLDPAEFVPSTKTADACVDCEDGGKNKNLKHVRAVIFCNLSCMEDVEYLWGQRQVCKCHNKPYAVITGAYLDEVARRVDEVAHAQPLSN